MIIVLTKNATVFINEKEYRSVAHDKDNECIIALRKATHSGDSVDSEYVNDVVSVHYYSDSEPVKFHDESNELKKAKEDYSKLLEQFKELRKEKFGADTDIIALSNQVDALKKQLAEYEAK